MEASGHHFFRPLLFGFWKVWITHSNTEEHCRHAVRGLVTPSGHVRVNAEAAESLREGSFSRSANQSDLNDPVNMLNQFIDNRPMAPTVQNTLQ